MIRADFYKTGNVIVIAELKRNLKNTHENQKCKLCLVNMFKVRLYLVSFEGFEVLEYDFGGEGLKNCFINIDFGVFLMSCFTHIN